MKGSLHTDELLGAVVKRDTGLRTARRLSHCFVLDVPGHPDPLIISDAAVNIAPTLEEKVDIVQNAIDLARALRFTEARVAILSAIETVSPKIPSTVEAARALQDGRSRPDHGRDPRRPARARQRDQPGGGGDQEDRPRPSPGARTCSSSPTSRPATCSPRACSMLAHADAAGIVLGAKVPIILTSRADSVMARLASCAVASLVAQTRRESIGKAIA